MGKIISIANFKGGVGKTATALNLAGALWICGKSVCVVDCDPQGDTTSRNEFRQEVDFTLTDWLKTYKRPGSEDIPAPIYNRYDRFDLIPTDESLCGIEKILNDEIASIPYAINDSLRAMSIRLSQIRNYYDYIIIDCPPNPGFINNSILIASDQVIVPVICSGESFEGVVKMKVKVQDIKDKVNPNIELLGCLIVDYDSRTIISKTVIEEISSLVHVFKTRIRHDVTVKESNAGFATIFEYCPKGRAAKDYMQFTEEAFGVKRPFKWFDLAPAAYASIAEDDDAVNDESV